MAITLSVGGLTVQLSYDLLWSDELTWSPVVQALERSTNGKAIVDVAASVGCRPITLVPPRGDTTGWCRRPVLLQLQAWASVPLQVMTLGLHGVDRQVLWRHQDAPAIDGAPISPLEGVADDDAYSTTLKFMEYSQ